MSEEMLKKEDEYFELLLKFCLKIDEELFIACDRICAPAVERLRKKAESLGVKKIFIMWQDARGEAQILRGIDCAEISRHPAFDLSIWNEYAARGAAFLIMKTEIPGTYDGVDEAKVVEAVKVKRTSQALYKKRQLSYEISWTIGILPNDIWANKLYPEEKDPYERFYTAIFESCMIGDGRNAIETWKKQIESNSALSRKLNNLHIRSLHYVGKNGTDLHVKISPEAVWMGADKSGMVVNMPTYEVYTFPDANGIDGVVRSTRPLMYNGVCIDEFEIEYRNGKAVRANAVRGEEALRSLLSCAPGSNSLGEAALVDCHSPVAVQNKNFGITLLDENAACHFAIGNAYPYTLSSYATTPREKLAEKGFNVAPVHVDFMIGYEGLDITADTEQGECAIMRSGRIVL